MTRHFGLPPQIQFSRQAHPPLWSAEDSRDSTRAFFIPGEPALQLGYFAQAMLDLFTLVIWLVLTCLGAVGIALSIYFLVSPIIEVV